MQQTGSRLKFVSASVATLLLLALLLGVGSSLWAQSDASGITLDFDRSTYSSPITLDVNNNLLWLVNPDDDKVTVIGNLDGAPSVLKTFNVGDEPQSIAIDTDASPTSYNVYVANAASNSVTVIKVDSSSASSIIGAVEKTLTTGAEPWNIVAAPNGSRIFVANSGQDTISVIDTSTKSVISNFNIAASECNDPDRNRHFQPRGLAVTKDGKRLFVTRFLSFTKLAGKQADDLGKEGIVCQLNIPDAVNQPLTFGSVVKLAALNTGFKIDNNKDGIADDTFAYPNQMQSIVIRGNQAYLPNIASSPSGPLRFNVDTQAFVNVIDNADSGTPADAGAAKSINMHLGARLPEGTKKKIFFSNPWAIAFTNDTGSGSAYAVSSGSDLLVKLAVDATGKLSPTVGVSTTRYINLNDSANLLTKGRNAAKNPLGIVIRNGNTAYVMNYISRNVSEVNLTDDTVTRVIETSVLPFAGSQDEQLLVGKEIFFSSRGVFNGGKEDRLSSEGWQTCSSCHFAGLTDANIWAFGAGPRKSVPLNGTWSPHNPDDQRVLNYSAIFDEVQDFELNIRNVSGPGNLSAGPPAVLNPNQGLIISDTGNINAAPAVVNAFGLANSGRQQLTVSLPNSNAVWPALDALKEWVRFPVRNPNGMLLQSEMSSNTAANNGALDATVVSQGRRLFFQTGCQKCHGGSKWTNSFKDFTSPPAATEIATEVGVSATVGAQFLPRFLFTIESFGLGTTLKPFGNNIGGLEVNEVGLQALGKDHNNDGKGNGFNVPSLLGIWHVQPYYHNGACETLICVVGNAEHRAKGLNGLSDPLTAPADQAKVVAFLQSLDAATAFPFDLRLSAHDIFIDPPNLQRGSTVVIGANVQLFGGRADFADVAASLGLSAIPVRFAATAGLPAIDVSLPVAAFTQDFGQATVTTTWNVPSDAPTIVQLTVSVDPANKFPEDNENNNARTRRVRTRAPIADTTAPVISAVYISDDNPFKDVDPISTARAVKIKIVASDSAPGTVKDFCIVSYIYDAVNRRWVEQSCVFAALPAPDSSAANIFTYTVAAELQATQGVQYAFVWVRDTAGNISRRPGFDFITFISGETISLNRNNAVILRIQLAAGQSYSLTAEVESGDVDVAVFNGFAAADPDRNVRCNLSVQNGVLSETVALPGPCVSVSGRLQIEIRAVVNSRFKIKIAEVSAAEAAAIVSSPMVGSEDLAPLPLVGGPPAAQTSIDEPEAESGGGTVYLPLVSR